MRLQDKVSIITGGASGMGRVAARMFAAEGARVVVADVSAPAAQSVVDEITAAGGQAVAVVADVSKEADAKRMVDETIAAFGRVDVLYNNAGIMPEADHSVVDTSVEDWDRVMAINVRGVFLGCKYAIPKMVEQGSGSVINISSFVALVGCSNPQDAYTASKGAVLALTKSLAVQFAPKGVRTNAICPGPVETPLLMDWLVKDEEAKRIRLARNPDRPLRQARGDRLHGDLSRLGRVTLDERRRDGHRRRHHGELLLGDGVAGGWQTPTRRRSFSQIDPWGWLESSGG